MSALAKLPNGNDYIRKHQNTITFLLGVTNPNNEVIVVVVAI